MEHGAIDVVYVCGLCMECEHIQISKLLIKYRRRRRRWKWKQKPYDSAWKEKKKGETIIRNGYIHICVTRNRSTGDWIG